MTNREERRLALQAQLDEVKTQAERNRMGQFATPTELARQILSYAKQQVGDASNVRFIDPAIGTGSFFSALLTVFPASSVMSAVGYEIDPHYAEPAVGLWKDTRLDLRIEDFTCATPPPAGGKYNLLICNPPYVRHHHIEGTQKQRLQALMHQSCGIEVSGLAGLYCYFLGLSHSWLAEGGVAGWLVPSEFMDVNYGIAVKRYLLDKVTLLHIHRFDPNEVQFGDALVSSSVVWFNKTEPPPDHEVRMSYGGSLLQPKMERIVRADTLRNSPKWTRYPISGGHSESLEPVLADFFTIKRGLATGDNGYFIISRKDAEARALPAEALTPILPSPRYLPQDEIMKDSVGNPLLDRQLFLLDCRLTEEKVKDSYPALWNYFEEGKERGIAERYICRHRSPWYTQEQRPAAPFLCTYLGRSDKKNGRPFRFILNHSKATAPNVYLMLYPKGLLANALDESPQLKHQIWEFLNGISAETMLNEGRVYGGGLHKLEPKELARVPAGALEDLLAEVVWADRSLQTRLLDPSPPSATSEYTPSPSIHPLP